MQQTALFDSQPATSGDSLQTITFYPSFEGFRDAARWALSEHIEPTNVWWIEDEQVKLPAQRSANRSASVNRVFLRLAHFGACHQSPDRWSLLYQILWRMTHGERHLMSLSGDPLIARLSQYEKSVRRDVHKMKAFVRFKSLPDDEGERFVAWFEPEHRIVRLVAPFFKRRFTNMRWSILTPFECVHWEGQGELCFSPGLDQTFHVEDELEQFWQVYYQNIFNPARLKVAAMRSEMPQKYWKNLPESALIPRLLLEADPRVDRMLQAQPEQPILRCGDRPANHQAYLQELQSAHAEEALTRLTARLADCQNCSLAGPATQAVPGEGPQDARVMLIGEQPGDFEDLRGRPFIGPAGQLLEELLHALGVSRETLYLTNAVKHFGFKPSAKRRLHERPKAGNIQACRPWLIEEIKIVNPEVIVCLGATALHAVLGAPTRIKDLSGHFIETDQHKIFATLHPAAVLRARHPAPLRARLRADLARALQA